MNSRERILTSLHCKQPDRVPFLESVIDEPVALQLLGCKPPDGLKGGELGTGEEPVLIGSLMGTDHYDALELARVISLDGLGMYLFLKHGGLQVEVDGHFMVSGGSVKTRGDLNKITLPDPENERMYEPYRQWLEMMKPTGLARYCFLNLGSDPAILGMGFETFAKTIYDDPSLVHELFDLYTGWYAAAAKILCEMDFDFLWFGDDIAFKTAPYVSPKVFRELFMPYYRKVTENISKPWIFHSDGNLYPILDDLLSLGMNGLHPIEPGAMDLADLKKRYGSKLCLVGHINVDTLSRGTPEDVENLVKSAIKDAASGGGYICGSSNSVPYYARSENVRGMTRAIQKYGRYPLQKF